MSSPKDGGLETRARAWALWKAALVLAGQSQPVPGCCDAALTVDMILEEARAEE